jgi:hypothetical protein
VLGSQEDIDVDWQQHCRTCRKTGGFLLLFRSLLLFCIQLVADTVRDIIMGLNDPALLYILHEGLQLMRSESIMLFPDGILPAVLPLIVAWRPGTTHRPIYIAPHRWLVSEVFSIHAVFSLVEHPLGC